MTLVLKENITHYIPQRSPIVMVDQIIEAGEEFATTTFNIIQENIFCENGFLREPGIIENIAQTAAAHAGYQCSLRNIAVPIGYIAAIKNLVIFDLPEIHQSLTTTIRVTNQIFNVTIIQANTSVGENQICSCEMKVFIIDPSIAP